MLSVDRLLMMAADKADLKESCWKGCCLVGTRMRGARIGGIKLGDGLMLLRNGIVVAI